ncbi:MAG: DUF5117 domain-containing protein, partial [Gemmatimonadales bacterium]
MRQLSQLAATLVAGIVTLACARAQSQIPSPEEPQRERPAKEIKPYDEVITDKAVTDSGLFQVHRVDDKYYFEIPRPMLDREMLLVSRLARTAANVGYGGMKNNTQTVRWQRNHKNVLLRVVSYSSVADDSLPIYEAVRNATFEPIVKSFDIAAFKIDTLSRDTVANTVETDTSAIVIDVSELYKVRNLDKGRTFIEWVKSFPRNIEVRVVLTYNAQEPPSNSSTGAISLEMNHSMILLPEVPMRQRLWDERVGFFRVQQTDYGRSDQKTVTRRYITRWRLEPKDTAAFLRGEPVEPVKPIVYYIDRATPEKWRPYLKQG